MCARRVRHLLCILLCACFRRTIRRVCIGAGWEICVQSRDTFFFFVLVKCSFVSRKSAYAKESFIRPIAKRVLRTLDVALLGASVPVVHTHTHT